MHLSADMKRPTLSLVVPVLNEEEAIPVFLAAVAPVLVQVRDVLGPASSIEILFVDDGSTDRTVETLRHAEVAHADVRLVKLSRNFGKDSALSAGLLHARGEAVVPMDVDLQDPPEILPRMVEAWRGGAVIVNAVRADRSSDDRFKRHSANAFYKLFNRLSSFPLHPDVGDFRLLDRKAVDIINQMPERIRFMKGIFSWVGFQPEEVSYTRAERAAGETKWKIWSLWNFALDGITGSTTLPLRIWSYVGGMLAVISVLYATFLVVRTMIYGVDTPGYASLMVVVLLLGSATFVALGIIGEYVGRIAVEVRQRPLYVVDTAETISTADLPAAAPKNSTRQD